MQWVQLGVYAYFRRCTLWAPREYSDDFHSLGFTNLQYLKWQRCTAPHTAIDGAQLHQHPMKRLGATEDTQSSQLSQRVYGASWSEAQCANPLLHLKYGNLSDWKRAQNKSQQHYHEAWSYCITHTNYRTTKWTNAFLIVSASGVRKRYGKLFFPVNFIQNRCARHAMVQAYQNKCSVRNGISSL